MKNLKMWYLSLPIWVRVIGTIAAIIALGVILNWIF